MVHIAEPGEPRAPRALLQREPAVGFAQPFEMLQACHERVHRMLRLLTLLAGHLESHGVDAGAVGAARDVMRYFDIAAPAHHEDEERHVIPWLAAHGRAALAQRLVREHRRMESEWQAIRRDLARIAAGVWHAGHAPGQRQRWEAFATLYERHIVAEERQAYPLVQAHGSAEALRRMGDEMAARRGLPQP
ncbi:hemerythrin domain-containing protein [Caldimonas sp. KR1-144]|uniref:hemerythrin domain-containing protein n=1 Tax=Caldimonas sp. KR1-144 TaxID=3400911 RepID=UPI003C08D881